MDIDGFHLLNAKSSAVDSAGRVLLQPIPGLHFRPTRPVPHEDGHVIEIARDDWEQISKPIVQVHMTTTLPGRIRAWGLHQHIEDRLFVAHGLIRIVCYDGRLESPAHGAISEITLSDRNPGLVCIAPNLFHGWKNIGTDEAIVINMPTSRYNYTEPDALDLPWDSEEAATQIPYRW